MRPSFLLIAIMLLSFASKTNAQCTGSNTLSTFGLIDFTGSGSDPWNPNRSEQMYLQANPVGGATVTYAHLWMAIDDVCGCSSTVLVDNVSTSSYMDANISYNRNDVIGLHYGWEIVYSDNTYDWENCDYDYSLFSSANKAHFVPYFKREEVSSDVVQKNDIRLQGTVTPIFK